MADIDMYAITGKHYEGYWWDEHFYRVCMGGRGSKKSKTTALNLIYRMFAYPEANAICLRRYGVSLRQSQYADLLWAMDRMGVKDSFDCTLSPLQITKKDTRQKILFQGLDDGLKTTSLSVEKGYLCWAWVEEAYEVKEDDFDKLEMGIRGRLPEGYFSQITLTFNPWSAKSWLKRRFFDKESPLTSTYVTTWKHNEWLSDVDKLRFDIMREENPRRYAIEGEGKWGVAEGLIYERVRVEDFNINDIRMIPGMRACFGLDFGFTDPTAFVACMVDNTARKIYVFDEWYKTGVTNRQIAEQIKSMGYGGQVIICDSAEPKSIAELQDEGLHTEGSRKGRDSVNFGIQQIQNYEIIVHGKCQNFEHEISNYVYAKDSKGQPTDKPDHEFSHGMDAMRYAVSRALVGKIYDF